MDPDSELEFEMPGVLRMYKTGRVERFDGTETVPPSPDGDPANGVASLKAVVIAACRADDTEAEAEPWLAAHGDASRIVLAGDSAGGNMAHNVAIRLRKEGGIEGYGDMVSGIVLLHPYFWGKEPLGAEPTDPGYRAMFDPTWEFICGGKLDLDHTYVNPLASPEEWRQLGSHRVLVTTAEQCWFVERARAYAEGIKKCGWEGELEFYETKGEAHVFFLPKHGSDNAVKELAVVAEFVRRC